MKNNLGSTTLWLRNFETWYVMMSYAPDRGVRHQIDLFTRTKYCVIDVTLFLWPLPKEECDVKITSFFSAKRAEGMVCESKFTHFTPTFCVKKHNGK